VPALPEGFAGTSTCADIEVAPSGTFVYASNRGHDSVVIHRIDRRAGTLQYVGHEPTRGRTPRSFGIDPAGKYLIVANQDSDTVVTFRIDPDTGKLQSTGQAVQVPTPVCVKFLASA
jgi:6-phosphogluconolactonase